MIKKMYNILLESYGYQGWWPLIDHKGVNPTKTGSVNGYHPKDYSLPKTKDEIFLICIGAILTQNTGWIQVEKALLNLKNLNALIAEKLLCLEDEKLKTAIKPAGYFNQKAKKLKIFADFYLKLKGRTPLRSELLNVWGIGNETADSILLYAHKKPFFVIDAYTKRIFSRLGICKSDVKYEELQKLVHNQLCIDNKPQTTGHKLFGEFHALIVEHAKRSCKTKPLCTDCVLNKNCEYFANSPLVHSAKDSKIH